MEEVPIPVMEDLSGRVRVTRHCLQDMVIEAIRFPVPLHFIMV
jgi:hypothetical protein